MTKILIVYAPKTKVPRRWVIPDHESELYNPAHVQPGEAAIIVDVAEPHAMHHEQVKQHIADHHGIHVGTIPTGRCHIIHAASGHIVGATHADPHIDVIPGHILVPTDD